MSDAKSRISKREPAKRVFAFEICRSIHSMNGAVKKILLPTGELCSRVYFVGALLEKEETQPKSGMWRLRISDPTGAVLCFAGKYQQDVLDALHDIQPPALVAVVGKLRVFEGDKGEVPYIRPESLTVVDANTRDIWLLETAQRTMERLEQMEKSATAESKHAWKIYSPDLNKFREEVERVKNLTLKSE